METVNQVNFFLANLIFFFRFRTKKNDFLRDFFYGILGPLFILPIIGIFVILKH